MNLLAQRQSREVEREITKIQHIDSKIKTDIQHLKERLKMNNDETCHKCRAHEDQKQQLIATNSRLESALADLTQQNTELRARAAYRERNYQR